MHSYKNRTMSNTKSKLTQHKSHLDKLWQKQSIIGETLNLRSGSTDRNESKNEQYFRND